MMHTMGRMRRGTWHAVCRRYCAATAAAQEEKVPEVEVVMHDEPRDISPRGIVGELDKHVVGQADAKRAVAIALRNKWRRYQLTPEIREELAPKNILMIGPTGCGKTEIARRLAKLTDAPYVKVEATKFTEVGFYGRDVDSIIDDLLKNSLTLMKTRLRKRNEEIARKRAEDRVLLALAGKQEVEAFRQHLREGALDTMDVTVSLMERTPPQSQRMPEIMSNPESAGGRKFGRFVAKKLKIKDAMPAVEADEMEKILDSADVQKEALRACEEDGIVVIDEIDKIVNPPGKNYGPQVSSEGVQQDLLPIIEGSTVTTKSGVSVKTDRILFICCGAFHTCSPSDMLAELQGRLPIRVELKALTREDFHRILTEPAHNLLRQAKALLATEDVDLVFTDEAIDDIAQIATDVNSRVQNIGARRLITVLERVTEDLSFKAPDLRGKTVTIDREYVQSRVTDLFQKSDLQRYLL